MHLISKGDREYILITVVWMTNKIGSSVSMWLYDCLNEKVQTTDNGIENVDYLVKKNGNSYMLEILRYDLESDIDIVPAYEDIFPDSGQLEFSRYISYSLESDGTIALKRRIETGAMDWLGSNILTTIYDIDDGKLVPVSFSIN
ncbi:MAG TPA: hypothetical protein VIL05_09720 [Thermoclostridium sp.]